MENLKLLHNYRWILIITFEKMFLGADGDWSSGGRSAADHSAQFWEWNFEIFNIFGKFWLSKISN